MRIVLAYSGGLDTTFCLRYLQEKYDAEVITVVCDVGQEEDLALVAERAAEQGSTEHNEVDCREELARDYLFPAVKANASYDGTYYLHSALHRPLIAKKVVEVAARTGATAVAHGNTGMGNDQFRYDISFRAYGPDLEIIAPVRDDRFTREAEVAYLEERGIPLPRPKDRPYSIDANLWGYFCGEFPGAEDPGLPTPEEVFERVRRRGESPEPKRIAIGFEEGVPVSLDGEEMDPVTLIRTVDALAGDYGYGWIDYVESSVFGTKIRQVVESPAAMTLIAAHQDLERLVLTRRQLAFKRLAEQRWSELVFEGLWIDPLREDLDALIDRSQQIVTGEVTLELRPGHVAPVARTSPFSLYDPELYSYDTESNWEQDKGAVFSELWGMASVVAYRRQAKVDALG
jgi:argininosuccinate synthase